MSSIDSNTAKKGVGMTCPSCGEKMMKVHGEYRERDFPFVGDIILKNVRYEACLHCDEKCLSNHAHHKFDKTFDHMVREKLLQQPIGDFVGSDEAARILKLKPQQLATRKVQRMLMLVKIGKSTFYLKRSVNKYRRHKRHDGRIHLKDLK